MAAAEASFVALRSQLRGFVARRVSESDIDDVLQEIHLKLARADLTEVESVSGFVYRVARNAVVDHHRRQRPTEELDEEPSGNEPSVEGDEASRIVASWLGPMVDSLPAPFAVTLRMTDLEGRTHGEVASELGVARSTITSRVVKGRALLRDKLTRCCAIELDARGHVVDWEPRDACCD